MEVYSGGEELKSKVVVSSLSSMKKVFTRIIAWVDHRKGVDDLHIISN